MLEIQMSTVGMKDQAKGGKLVRKAKVYSKFKCK